MSEMERVIYRDTTHPTLYNAPVLDANRLTPATSRLPTLRPSTLRPWHPMRRTRTRTKRDAGPRRRRRRPNAGCQTKSGWPNSWNELCSRSFFVITWWYIS